VILTLFAYKLACPSGLNMTRGNHESKNMNKMYGFEGEVKHKLDNDVARLFTAAFCKLPLCAVIEDRVFVVHGGLPSDDGVRSIYPSAFLWRAAEGLCKELERALAPRVS